MHKDVKVGIEYHKQRCAACSKKASLFITLKENRIVYLCKKCAETIGTDLVLNASTIEEE